MTEIKEKRELLNSEPNGRLWTTKLWYYLQFGENGKLTQILNQSLFPVDEKSDCWEYFNKLYSKGI